MPGTGRAHRFLLQQSCAGNAALIEQERFPFDPGDNHAAKPQTEA